MHSLSRLVLPPLDLKTLLILAALVSCGMLAGALVLQLQQLQPAPAPASPVVHEAVIALTSRVEQLEQQACVDDLTGLPNGRLLEQQDLPDAIRRCAELGRPLTLAYIDLDGFKAINDTFGHAAADGWLRKASHVMQAATRRKFSLDRIYRSYKMGDEFLALFAGADADQGRRNVESILAALNAAGIEASIGMVVLPAGRRSTARQLIEYADAAMRTVKQSGKNRIHVELLR